MSFAQALKYLREKSGRSQADVAAGTSVQQSHISAIECGTKEGIEATRRDIARTLGWAYDAMMELGRHLDAGMDQEEAAARAQARYAPELPPPIIAANLDELVGFHVVVDGVPVSKTVWVHRDSLGDRKRGDVAVHEFREVVGRVTALIDYSKPGREPESGRLYLVKVADESAVLRVVKGDPDVWLLFSLDGAVQATSEPWDAFVRGRVLWYQVDLELAE